MGETIESALHTLRAWLECQSIPAINCKGLHCDQCEYDHGGSTGMMIAVEAVLDYFDKKGDNHEGKDHGE